MLTYHQGIKPKSSDILKLQERYDFDDESRRDVQILHSWAGYSPNVKNRILIWTRKGKLLGGRFALNVNKKPVVKGRLKYLGTCCWGRHNWEVMLPQGIPEGQAELDVSFADCRTTAKFRISKNLFEELCEKSCKHFFLKRCGIFCHTDDAPLRSVRQDTYGKILKHVDVSGGWHDAHDDDKFLPLAVHCPWALVEVYEAMSPRWKGAGEALPHPLSEAWWEIDFFLKLQKKDGSFYHGVFEWDPARRGGRNVNRVCEGVTVYDDMHDSYANRALVDVWGKDTLGQAFFGHSKTWNPSTPEKYFIFAAASIARFANAVRLFDGGLAKRCMAAARKTLALVESRKPAPYQYIHVQNGLALVYLELYRWGDADAIEKAKEAIIRILDLQQPEGHFHASKKCRALEMYPEEAGDERVFIDQPFSYVMCLTRILEIGEQDELSDRVKHALKRFFEFAVRLSGASQFGHLPEYTLRPHPSIVMPVSKTHHGYTSYFLAMGYLAAKTARWLHRDRLLDFALRQLEWTLGANPRHTSFMNDMGERSTGYYLGISTAFSKKSFTYYRHNRDYRWGITTGIYGPTKRQPANYPNVGLENLGYTPKAQETWNCPTGWMALLTSALAKLTHRTS